ncbi:hypothetical protein ACM25N_15815 [Roseovarius sp. C7]|uniref:hypothetical protein n=1 Tax=Roseovarius sp. C7 TaxID=3398643 RepID=UPI0039F66FB6
MPTFFQHALACLLLMLWAGGAPAQQLTPDSPDPVPQALAHMLSELVAAAETGEAAAIAPYLSQDALAGFGSDGGPKAFLQDWGDSSGANRFARLAQELRHAIAAGGTRIDATSYQFPFYTEITHANVDPLQVGWLTPKAKLRGLDRAPAGEAAPSGESVFCADMLCRKGDEAGGHTLTQVVRHDGRNVLVRGRDVTAVLEVYRLLVERTPDGPWQVSLFLAGD